MTAKITYLPHSSMIDKYLNSYAVQKGSTGLWNNYFKVYSDFIQTTTIVFVNKGLPKIQNNNSK